MVEDIAVGLFLLGFLAVAILGHVAQRRYFAQKAAAGPAAAESPSRGSAGTERPAHGPSGSHKGRRR